MVNIIAYTLTIFVFIFLTFNKSKNTAMFLFTTALLFSINYLILPFFSPVSKRVIFIIIILSDISFLLLLKKNLRTNRILNSHPIIMTIYFIIVLAGTAEGAVVMLHQANLIKLYSPLLIMGRGEGDDWRRAHITGDKSKVYDPVMFWKPSTEYPYNKYGFKGIPYEDKKSSKKRIFFYGDSNTDGQDLISYPYYLQRMFQDSFEVFNAGVAGWSSYQGLKRLKEDVGRWSPDVVFFSFGWNDAAGGMGKQDKDYNPPSEMTVKAQRFLLNYKIVLLFLNQIKREETKHRAYQPRVAKSDYIGNMKEVLSLCREKNIRVVFMTRPYAYDSVFFKTDSTFRRFVPEYNETLRVFASENQAELLDIEGEFFGREEYFADESHFNEKGYEKMAEIISGCLR
ncbi:MAG: SGNH/GDSL hydrolase family protein [bacterium]